MVSLKFHGQNFVQDNFLFVPQLKIVVHENFLIRGQLIGGQLIYFHGHVHEFHGQIIIFCGH